jgi:hypothetical protein
MSNVGKLVIAIVLAGVTGSASAQPRRPPARAKSAATEAKRAPKAVKPKVETRRSPPPKIVTLPPESVTGERQAPRAVYVLPPNNAAVREAANSIGDEHLRAAGKP